MKRRGRVKQFPEQILVPMNLLMRNAIEYTADYTKRSMAEVVRDAIQHHLSKEISERRSSSDLQNHGAA